MINRSILSVFLILIFGFGCSGITPISKAPPEESKSSYNEAFLKQMEQAKSEFAKNNFLEALAILEKIPDPEIAPQEKALKYNLKGVIHFSGGKFDEAAKAFDIAESISHSNEELRNHIRLNRSGTAIKLGNHAGAYNLWQGIDASYLPPQEKIKYFQMAQLLGEKLGQKDLVLIGLAHKYQNFKIAEIDGRVEGKQLVEVFDQLSYGEKMRVLAGQESKPVPTPFGFLGLKELNRAKLEGRTEDQERIEKWLKENFENDPDLNSLFLSEQAIEPAEFNPLSIGVVLPFTAEKKSFSDKALEGINLAFREIFSNDQSQRNGKNYELFIEDNQDNPVGGSFAVRKLAEKNHVSFIIGGLFPNEAISEYREARKYGIHFVSLSPVYLPAKDKDEFLVEVAGSLESQLASLKESGLIEKFGNKVGVFFPNDSKGKYSAQVIWDQAKDFGLEVRRVQPFNKDEVDFRIPVQKFLGNYFKRARKEEAAIWKGINANRRDAGRKKYAEIPPVIDFDWVFLPAFPQQVEMIIPLFSYFDAESLNYFGDPSWYSAKLARKNSRLGPLYFSGPELGEEHKQFVDNFKTEYGKVPKLIESLGYEGMKAVGQALLLSKSEDRASFSEFLKSSVGLKGLSGNYVFKNGRWNKNLSTFRILREEIVAERLTQAQAEESVPTQKK